MGQRVHRRLVEVPVEPHDGEFPDRCGRQRVLEPSFEEAHLIVEQPVLREPGLHLLEGDRQVFVGVPAIPRVRRVFPRIRNRAAGERVRRPHDAVGDAVRPKHATHEDRRTPAPDPRLDEIPGHPVSEALLDAVLQVVQPRETDHGVRENGPVPSHPPLLRIVGDQEVHPEIAPGEVRTHEAIQRPMERIEDRPVVRHDGLAPERVGEALLQQVEVGCGRVVHARLRGGAGPLARGLVVGPAAWR